MSIGLTTAGIKVYYGVHTAMPTALADWTEITEIKSIPDMNPEPSTYETTTLAQTVNKTYIDALKDMGGTLAFTCNLTDDFVDEWEALVTAYEAGQAKSTTEYTYFAFYIPGITEWFYIRGTPNALGMSGADTDALLEIDVYIVPDEIIGYDTAPTLPV